MTTKRLNELARLNKTKNEFQDIITDCEKGYYLELKTMNNATFIEDDDFKKSLVKLMRDKCEEYHQIINNA